MNKLIIILFLFPLFTLSQNNNLSKNYISIGLFDHKTGFSVAGYTRSIIQNSHNEVFVGFGSMIALNTFTIGYKKYLFKSIVDGYSVISMQKIHGMPGSSNAACLSIGIEKKIWKILFINIGVNVTNLIEDLESLTFPSLTLNIRY